MQIETSCVYALVFQCGRYAKENPELKIIIEKFTKDDTGFGFEDNLLEILEK